MPADSWIVGLLLSVRNDDTRVLLSHKVDVPHGKVLADDVSPVVTLGVVPGQAVIEEVIQDGEASLLAEAVLFEDSVRLSSSSGAGAGPGVELAAREVVSWSHRPQGGSPEPAVDVVGLEPRLVTTVNLLVTQSPTGPHLSDSTAGHVLSDEVVLPATLQGDEVHTSHPAVVPGSEPVPPGISQRGLVTVPGEPVGLSSWTFLVSNLFLSFSAELSIRQADLSFTARVDLCSFPVPGAVPGDSVPQELALSVLSHWPPALSVSIGSPVVLSFSESEEETEHEKRSQHSQHFASL